LLKPERHNNSVRRSEKGPPDRGGGGILETRETDVPHRTAFFRGPHTIGPRSHRRLRVSVDTVYINIRWKARPRSRHLYSTTRHPPPPPPPPHPPPGRPAAIPAEGPIRNRHSRARGTRPAQRSSLVGESSPPRISPPPRVRLQILAARRDPGGGRSRPRDGRTSNPR